MMISSGRKSWGRVCLWVMALVFTSCIIPVACGQVSATLEMSPWKILRGSNATLTATVDGGEAPYSYQYQYRPGGTPTWLSSSLTGAVNVAAWPSNAQYRVRVTDGTATTSDWSAAASVVVIQPSVSVSFDPSVITQSQSSVVSAVVTNATEPVEFEWQFNTGSGWEDDEGHSEATFTNVWGFDTDARARSIDANGVTSDWSTNVTLTVHPSELAADLSFSPTSVLRGVSSVVSAVASNGTAPYTYSYQWRYSTNDAWTSTSSHAGSITNAWVSNITFRVHAVDHFSSTSEWAEADLIVVQPEVTVEFTPGSVTQSQSSVLSATVT
ncbi:MAG: hypothetical protein EOL87_10415, partial [Spartobacteria bacterium]|nr:hypothetical protein [Spartobacteria bacterium]